MNKNLTDRLNFSLRWFVLSAAVILVMGFSEYQ